MYFTCRAEPAGRAQRRGPAPSEKVGRAAAADNGAGHRSQAPGQGA